MINDGSENYWQIEEEEEEREGGGERKRQMQN